MNDRKQPQVAVGADRGTLIGNMGREKRMPVVRSAVLPPEGNGQRFGYMHELNKKRRV